MIDTVLRKKWILVVAALIVVLIVIVLISLRMAARKRSAVDTIYQNAPLATGVPIVATREPETSPLPSPTQSPELRAAIEAQTKVDQEYGTWQVDNRHNYPWRNRLPAYNDKYYVYFDIDKQVFIGLLYPKVGDDVEAIKTEVFAYFKEKEIPTDLYPFEWTVAPE